MKKLSLLLLFFCLLPMTRSFAQTETKNVVKINLPSLAVLTGSFFYERAVAQKVSLQMGAYYSGFGWQGVKYRSFGFTPELRYYITKDAPTGLYVGPFVRFQQMRLSEKTTEETGKVDMIGGGALIGYQWIFSERVALDVFLGPAYYRARASTSVVDNDSFNSVSFGGPTVRFGLALGVAF